MTDAAAHPGFAPTDTAASPPRPPKDDWPLMGDITGHRAGVPDLLILWARARGDTDPRPSFW